MTERWISVLLDWMKRRGAARSDRSSAAEQAPQDTGTNAGEYQLLYKYLRDRYANRVVLTFAEIEDLLGFTLPALARAQPEWWGGTAVPPHRSAQSVAWTMAGRTVAVNLAAQSVVFDREPGLDARAAAARASRIVTN